MSAVHIMRPGVQDGPLGNGEARLVFENGMEFAVFVTRMDIRTVELDVTSFGDSSPQFMSEPRRIQFECEGIETGRVVVPEPLPPAIARARRGIVVDGEVPRP